MLIKFKSFGLKKRMFFRLIMQISQQQLTTRKYKKPETADCFGMRNRDNTSQCSSNSPTDDIRHSL